MYSRSLEYSEARLRLRNREQPLIRLIEQLTHRAYVLNAVSSLNLPIPWKGPLSNRRGPRIEDNGRPAVRRLH
jgi:hypothetical protein